MVGLVPSFDTRATRASRFICHAANFRLGLIILVMPADVEVRTAACLVACLHAYMTALKGTIFLDTGAQRVPAAV